MTWHVDRREAVAVLALDRPPDNLMNAAALRELDAELERVASDEAISVVMITGARPGVFLGHADVSELGLDAAGDRSVGLDGWFRTLRRIETIPQPVVAAIDGRAWGGGCELAISCSLRIGSLAAEFCQMEITRGAMPGAGATQRLPRLIGFGRAAEMVLTGAAVSAEEARTIGLLNAILDGPDFREAALAWLARMASLSRAALVNAKRALNEGRDLSLLDGLAHEQHLFREVFGRRANE